MTPRCAFAAFACALCLGACHATPAPVVVAPVAALRPAPVFVPPDHHRRIVVTSTDIEILDTITFVGNTAQLAPASDKILDAIARTMAGNPSILLMQVRGHSDWQEPDRAVRAELAIQRAEAVVDELVARGVARARLEAYGASDDELLSTTDPVANRRIELFILDRD